MFVILLFLFAHPAGAARVDGVIVDATSAPVPGAAVSILDARRIAIATTSTDAGGSFRVQDVPAGNHVLRVAAPGFETQWRPIEVRRNQQRSEQIVLRVAAIREEVTVTAMAGSIEAAGQAIQRVNIIGRDQIEARATSVLAQAVEEEPGLALQRTSPTIGGVFVRGLTGNKVNVFVDGVRYSTSAMRGGINTFLNLIDPASADVVEVIRGPQSAQYGSDALGGSIQVLSPMPAVEAGGRRIHGQTAASLSAADAGYGTSAMISIAGPKNLALLASLDGRRANTLRAGGGLDSHSAVTRFLGLPSTAAAGDRLPDTGFTQYGGSIRLAWSPGARSHWIASYQRGQQDGGKRYDQLLGGDGNLIADLRNLMLDFFYLRYERQPSRALDRVSLTYSYNAQREERVNQGGNGNPLGAITHEYERTRVHGVQAEASKLLGRGHSLVTGGEYYAERLRSPSFAYDPAAGVFSVRRGRIPDHAGYASGGAWAQDSADLWSGRVRLVGSVRISAADYRVQGGSLWPSDSLRASNWTWRAGAAVRPGRSFHIFTSISRGFRAPHMTDLGTLGLTGSGFEVAAPDVAGRGAMVGSTAGPDARSTGLAVEQVRPETSINYEAGVAFNAARLRTEAVVFLNDIRDNITRQALLLPAGATEIAGQKIVAQTPEGAVFVEASPNPVLVRTNFDNARIRGFEYRLDARVRSAWTARFFFTALHAHDTRTGLQPNIEGGTPAPGGFFELRYHPAGRRFWLAPYGRAAWRQDRLSSLDFQDRRTGAARTRAAIRSFFRNGATVRGLAAGNVLLATGETLAQVQDRVLGTGVDSLPLFVAVPGYAVFGVRVGIDLAERQRLLLAFENIGDRNYRGISSGLDGPGRSVYVRYALEF